MIEINLALGYEPDDPTSYYIEYWYDRHKRLWVVQVFDNLDREVNCTYTPKDCLNSYLKDFSEEYNTTDIRKV